MRHNSCIIWCIWNTRSLLSILYIMNKCGITAVHFCTYLHTYLQHTQHIRQCGLVFCHRREEDKEVVCGSIREQLEVIWGVLQWKDIARIVWEYEWVCGSMSGCVGVWVGVWEYEWACGCEEWACTWHGKFGVFGGILQIWFPLYTVRPMHLCLVLW